MAHTSCDCGYCAGLAGGGAIYADDPAALVEIDDDGTAPRAARAAFARSETRRWIAATVGLGARSAAVLPFARV
jgi:hypothetical protein